MTSEKYRQFAKDCVKWADQTANPSIRDALLDLARDYAALASSRGLVAAVGDRASLNPVSGRATSG